MSTPSHPGRALRRTALSVVALFAVLSLAALLRFQDAPASATPAEEVDRAAREAVVALMSYDHRTIDADIERAVEHLHGSFAREYGANLREHREEFLAVHGSAEAAVVDSAVAEAGHAEARVLVFVDQTVRTDKTGQEPQVDHARVRLDLELRDSRWLVTSLDYA